MENTILEQWLQEIYQNFKRRNELLYENPWSIMPHENNLLIDIAALAEKYNYTCLVECSFSGLRRDAVLISTKSNWMMQIEMKHTYYISNETIKEIEDIDRINDVGWLRDYAKSTLSRKLELEKYKLSGLFIGIGFSWMYKWWLSMDNTKQKQNLLSHGPELEAYYDQLLERWQKVGTNKGIYPNGINTDEFWLLWYRSQF